MQRTPANKVGTAQPRRLTPTREGMIKDVAPDLASKLYALGVELLAASHSLQQGKMEASYSDLAARVQNGALDISMLCGMMIALENQKE